MATDNPIIALVDDDKIFQLTASKTILATKISNNILQFESAEDALTYLKDHLHEPEKLPDFIFLDINMPLVDGWMFLDDFVSLQPTLSKHVIIYMVSSSIDPKDISRAKEHVSVTDYVIKPVTSEKFQSLLQRSN